MRGVFLSPSSGLSLRAMYHHRLNLLFVVNSHSSLPVVNFAVSMSGLVSLSISPLSFGFVVCDVRCEASSILDDCRQSTPFQARFAPWKLSFSI